MIWILFAVSTGGSGFGNRIGEKSAARRPGELPGFPVRLPLEPAINTASGSNASRQVDVRRSKRMPQP